MAIDGVCNSSKTGGVVRAKFFGRRRIDAGESVVGCSCLAGVFGSVDGRTEASPKRFEAGDD